jgi:DNA repair exonuclease SbcCD ATPase subunit
MKKLREDLEHRAKKESEEIEERKNTHIRELMKKHEAAFVEIRNYYNNITTNNLVLIKTLKDDVASMKKNEANNEKLMFEIAEDNKRLSEPLVVALAEVNQLRHELANYNKDKLSLKEAKKRLVQFEEQLKNLKWEHEILEQSHTHVQAERDSLYQKFERTIHDVQQKTTFKNQLLETKVGALHETIEKKDAQLREIMKVSKLDENTLGSITSTMEDVIEEKNKQIRDLQFDCEKLKKAHNDLVRTISDKLKQYGIPPEELGMRTVFPSSTTSAPAGLV